MADIKILVGGVCKKCNHPQQTHEDNNGCTLPVGDEPCGCESVGSY